MYEVSIIENSKSYLYKSKNSLGQILSLEFTPDEYSNVVYWNLCFWIGKNRRGFECLMQTGKDGVRSLLWAKRCIIDFMAKFDKHEHSHHICISWDDNRRRAVYLRGLSDLGFKLCRIERRMYIHKKLT